MTAMEAVALQCYLRDPGFATMRSCPFVDVTECMRWYAMYDEQAHGILSAKRYPSLRPPFPAGVFYGTMPGTIRTLTGLRHVGEHIVIYSVMISLMTEIKTGAQYDGLTIHVHTTFGQEQGIVAIGTATFPLDVSGALVGNEFQAQLDSHLEEQIADDDETGLLLAKSLDDISQPVLFALALCHAKNVQLAPAQPPRSIRRGKDQTLAKVTFKTLEIGGLRSQAEGRRAPGASTHLTALHLCRGSFATYTEDAKLFGRVAGTFWRPAHVKGNAARGVVYKDYRIKVP